MATRDFYVPVEDDSASSSVPARRLLRCPSSSSFIELKKTKRGLFRTRGDWVRVSLRRIADASSGITSYFPIQDLKDNGRYKCSNRAPRYTEWRFSELCNVDEACRNDPSQCAIGIRAVPSSYRFEGPSYAVACFKKIPVQETVAEPVPSPYDAESYIAPYGVPSPRPADAGSASMPRASVYVPPESRQSTTLEWI